MIDRKIKIDLNYLRPNASFIYPLFSEDGRKIIDSRIVLSADRIKEIIQKFGPVVYYTDKGERAVIPRHRMNAAYNTAVNVMEEISRTSKLSRSVYKESEKLVEDIIHDLNTVEIDAISLIKDLKSYDDYLYNHSVNVGILSAVFSKKIGRFSNDEVKYITLGAYLHDIGEKMIDKQLLNKEGKLDVSEIQKMRRHPQLGYEILKKTGNVDNIVLQSVLFHHERYNNRGYYQLPFENLPVYPKVVSICDIFDALTSERPFRKQPISIKNTLKAILNSVNIHYHYELINNFLNTMTPILNNGQNFYAVNEICSLSTNELALIKEYSKKDILKPGVLVFCKFSREKYNTIVNFYDKPFEVNLEDDNVRNLKKILSNSNQLKAIYRKIKERGII